MGRHKIGYSCVLNVPDGERVKTKVFKPSNGCVHQLNVTLHVTIYSPDEQKMLSKVLTHRFRDLGLVMKRRSITSETRSVMLSRVKSQQKVLQKSCCITSALVKVRELSRFHVSKLDRPLLRPRFKNTDGVRRFHIFHHRTSLAVRVI